MADQSFNTQQNQEPDNPAPTFAQTEEPNSAENNNVQQPTEGAYIEVNGRKYTQEEAIKKIQNADEHISKIENENGEFRDYLAKATEQLERLPKLEEALEKAMASPQSKEPEQNLDVDAIVEQARNSALDTLSQREQEQKRQKNFEEVAARLQKEFGEASDDEVRRRAGEVGYSWDQAVQLAQDNPRAFFRVLGMEQRQEPKPENSPAPSEVRSEGLNGRPRTEPSVFEGWSSARSDKQRIEHYDAALKRKLDELGIKN